MEIHIIIIVVCVFLSAYFSATETAFSTFNRIRVKNMAEKGNKRADLVLTLSDNYDSLISAILIGNNIVNIASTSIATVLFISLIRFFFVIFHKTPLVKANAALRHFRVGSFAELILVIL